MNESVLTVIDELGNEVKMDILFTFNDDTYKKDYVLYVDPKDETGEVFVSAYTEDGVLNEITDSKEWEMIEEVFSAFVIQHEGEDHVHDENCNHEHTH